MESGIVVVSAAVIAILVLMTNNLPTNKDISTVQLAIRIYLLLYVLVA